MKSQFAMGFFFSSCRLNACKRNLTNGIKKIFINNNNNTKKKQNLIQFAINLLVIIVFATFHDSWFPYKSKIYSIHLAAMSHNFVIAMIFFSFILDSLFPTFFAILIHMFIGIKTCLLHVFAHV